MFGRLNKLYSLLVLVCFFSCEEQRPEPIYKGIPTRFNYVFENIRSLDENSTISVSSSTGLSDRLELTVNPQHKSYRNLYSSYNVPGIDTNNYFVEYYSQTLIPSLYNFYNFNYRIDFDRSENSYYLDPQDSEKLNAIFDHSNVEIFNYDLTDNSIISKYPYEVLTNLTLNAVTYSVVYKITNPSPTSSSKIKIYYFTLSHGVIRFETISNEIFDISI